MVHHVPPQRHARHSLGSAERPTLAPHATLPRNMKTLSQLQKQHRSIDGVTIALNSSQQSCGVAHDAGLTIAGLTFAGLTFAGLTIRFTTFAVLLLCERPELIVRVEHRNQQLRQVAKVLNRESTTVEPLDEVVETLHGFIHREARISIILDHPGFAQLAARYVGLEVQPAVRFVGLEAQLAVRFVGLEVREHEGVEAEHAVDHLVLVGAVGVVALEDEDRLLEPVGGLVLGRVVDRDQLVVFVEVHVLHARLAHVAPLLEAAPATALVGGLVDRLPRVLVDRVGRDDDKVLRERREDAERVDGSEAHVHVRLRDREVVEEDVEVVDVEALHLAERVARGDHLVVLELVGVGIVPREPLVREEDDGLVADEFDEVVIVVDRLQIALLACVARRLHRHSRLDRRLDALATRGLVLALALDSCLHELDEAPEADHEKHSEEGAKHGEDDRGGRRVGYSDDPLLAVGALVAVVTDALAALVAVARHLVARVPADAQRPVGHRELDVGLGCELEHEHRGGELAVGVEGDVGVELRELEGAKLRGDGGGRGGPREFDGLAEGGAHAELSGP
eukprot:scaffold37620_cov64-Phaeocystis_antarctica.AAC.4